MIGTQIGHLTITRKLGEGGMGAVYLAQHRVLDSLWVIKVLLPKWSQDGTMVQRFINEAKAASSIAHASIIEVGDCGQLAGGTWYIVMKYLDGGTLDRFLESQGGPISMHLALQIVAPVADGLEAAHAREIIHCDLKPENIYLVIRGANPHHPVILDFGIARMSEQVSGVRTAPGMIAGTLAYMAPEQIFDRRTVDRRSDVYALAVILYQMVTGGWLPFQQSDAPAAFFDLAPTAVYQLQKETAPIDPRKRGAQISDGFASAILAALQYDAARRPQTLRAFIVLLAQATPGDRYQPSGVEIVRRYAENLLEIGNLNETVRGPKPAVIASSTKIWRYQLGEQIGAGGMAEVFRGTMTGAEGFARPVAIKRILPELSTLPRFAQMFVQEAQIASQLSHPNVVSVLDFDHDPDGRLILVLEFVEGMDLHRLMASGPIPHSVIIFVVTEILSGLGYAHNLPAGGNVRGIVHRDVSPHNVLLSWEAAVKLSDFGLAKPREASEASASIQLKGKVAYMSPEQINGNALDGRSDLFAVGVILHEMLTGERLFWKDDIQTTMYRVLDRPIPKPSLQVPVAPDLEAVVMRLLERDLASRYATAEKASEALAGCVDASLRSRGELTRLLAERFPQEASSRTSRPPSPGERAEGAEPPPDRGRASSSRSRTGPLASSSQATSLSLAASESMQPSLHAPRRRRLLARVAITVTAVGALGVFVGIRGRHERQTTRTAGADVPTLPTNATSVTAPSDAMVRDAAMPDVLPAPDAAAPVAVVPAASPSTMHIVRPPAAAPATETKPPRAAPARRPSKPNSDDVGGD
jgi:serine/threonine protein kinase